MELIGKRHKTTRHAGVIILHHDGLYYEVLFRQTPRHLTVTIGVGRALVDVGTARQPRCTHYDYTGKMVPETVRVALQPAHTTPSTNGHGWHRYDLLYIGQEVYLEANKDRVWSTVCKYPEEFMSRFQLITQDELQRLVPRRSPNCTCHVPF